jgi:hypothetical protein
VSGHAPGGSAWANTFWMASTVANPTPTQMNTIASGLYGLWKTQFQGQLGSNWTITLGKCTYYGAAGFVSVGQVNATDVGTGPASVQADQVCIVLSWVINTTWRGGKPRTYLAKSIQSSDLVDLAHIGPTVITALQGLGNAWITAVNGYSSAPLTSMQLGTIRFFSLGVPLTAPIFVPYVSCKVTSRIDTMRRRLGKG